MIKYQLNDPLYINSIFIFASRTLLMAVGFFFWIIAARLYSVDEIGIAVALISSAAIINLLSLLGFENSIIRFFSAYDTRKIINTSIIIVGAASLFIGLGYAVTMALISSNLSLIGNPANLAVFIGFVVLSSVALVVGNVFIAMRKTGYYLLQNFIISSRIILLVPLLFLGSFGIISSTLVAYVLAFAFIVFILGKFVKLDFKVDREYIGRSLKFSSANYVGTLLAEVPYLVLPIMVLHILGEAGAAKYYIAFSLGSILMQITYTVSTSLFVEGSRGESMRKNVIKSFVAIYSLMVPAFVFIFFFGNAVLGLYGNQYTDTLDLLKLVAASGFFYTIYSVFCAIKRVTMGIRSIVLLNLIMFVLSLALSYVLMPVYGITGVGYALIITFVILDVIVLGIVKMEGWI
jgi:O-antigen/teichoic acid export membrane protein